MMALYQFESTMVVRNLTKRKLVVEGKIRKKGKHSDRYKVLLILPSQINASEQWISIEDLTSDTNRINPCDNSHISKYFIPFTVEITSLKLMVNITSHQIKFLPTQSILTQQLMTLLTPIQLVSTQQPMTLITTTPLVSALIKTTQFVSTQQPMTLLVLTQQPMMQLVSAQQLVVLITTEKFISMCYQISHDTFRMKYRKRFFAIQFVNWDIHGPIIEPDYSKNEAMLGQYLLRTYLVDFLCQIPFGKKMKDNIYQWNVIKAFFSLLHFS